MDDMINKISNNKIATKTENEIKDTKSNDLQIIECKSNSGGKREYYTVINQTNNTHVHCIYRSTAIKICNCYKAVMEGRPVNKYTYNIRNKVLKLCGFKIKFR